MFKVGSDQAEPPAQFPRMEKGSQRMSYGEGFSSGGAAKRSLTTRPLKTMHCSGVWEGENPHYFLLLLAFGYSGEHTLSQCVLSVLQTFTMAIQERVKFFYSSKIKLEN